MNATTPQESSLPGDEGELPTPSFSGDGDSSTSSGADANVSKSRSELLEELKPFIQETIERQVQSTKDIRIAKIEGRLGLLTELEEQGATIPDNLKQEMRFRDLEERLTRPVQSTTVRDDGSSQQKAAVTDAIAELNKYGLDPNDAGFIELLRGKYANRAEFDLKVQRHVVAKLAPTKPANPADVVQAPVRSGATEQSQEALTSEYLKEMSGARGKGYIIGDAIKEKYRKLKLNVDEIAIRV